MPEFLITGGIRPAYIWTCGGPHDERTSLIVGYEEGEFNGWIGTSGLALCPDCLALGYQIVPAPAILSPEVNDGEG